MLVKVKFDEEFAADELDHHVPFMEQMNMHLFARVMSTSGINLNTIVPMSLHKPVVKEEAHGLEESTSDEFDAENGTRDGGIFDAEEKPVSLIMASLQSFKEALANDDKSAVTEVEAFLQSIEDERKSLENKVMALSQKLSSERDRILQISADFDDFRKRTERERLSLVSNVQGEVVENLLPVLHNFERTKYQINIETEGEEKISNSYQSIYKQFIEILGSLGVGAVETVGNPFDPMEFSLGESSNHMEDVNLPCIGKMMGENHLADRILMVQEPCADSINETDVDGILMIQEPYADSINETNVDRFFRTSTSLTDNFTNSASPGSSSAVTHCSPKVSKCLHNSLVEPSILQESQGIESRCSHMEDVDLPCTGKMKTENHPGDRRRIVQEPYADIINETNVDIFFKTSTSSTENFISSASTCSSSAVTHCSPKTSDCLDTTLAKPSNLQETQGIESRCSHLTSLPDAIAPNNNVIHSALPSFPMQMKVENLETGLMGPSSNHLGNFSKDMPPVKVKREILGESFASEVDHIPLQERLKMLGSSRASGLHCSGDLNCLKQIVPGTLECDPVDSVNIKRSGATVRRKRKKIVKDSEKMEHVPGASESDPINSVKASRFTSRRKRKKTLTDSVKLENAPGASESDPVDSAKASRFTLRRKRKKTVTDSVETALEEDAPGLLQVLVDKGINVDEIKLYGDAEDADALDISADEDGFSELESVISKLFWQRSTLLKFASVRNTKGGSKDKYCLACLVSLVEQLQTRYLQFRKWPVEWGWCRDLQSFIFVFERHNRIVLERPEYGYATYFFEVVESLPINWQIKRLVTAMKLTSCSRITLIENRALLVGEDLTEGEAQVLEEYGWVPNSGLGTMLHYCDRVVHDRRSEVRHSESEWTSKIRRLLMDGHDGGSIVLPNLPKRVIEYKDDQNQQIKLEV